MFPMLTISQKVVFSFYLTFNNYITHFLVEKIAKIRKWTCTEANGLIFVWYHAENEEPWELPVIETDGMWLHGSNEFMVQCHIQDIPENGADTGKGE